MNNTFDFGRFMRLVNRQWINFGKIYLMTLGVIAAIFIALYSYYIKGALDSQDNSEIITMLSFRPYMFVILGLFFISIVSSVYFSNLGNKSKAVFEIMIPASSLEKFLTGIFYTVILTISSYFLVFYIIDFGFVTYVKKQISSSSLSAGMEPNPSNFIHFYDYFFKFQFPTFIYRQLYIPFLLSSIFLLGSLYFKTFHFIKTAISVSVYVFVFIYSTFKIMSWVTKDSIIPEQGFLNNNENNAILMISIIGIILTCCLWVISFVRLKEKEV